MLEFAQKKARLEVTNWLKEGKLAAPIMEAFEDGLCEIYNEPQALGRDSASVHSQTVDANSAKASPDQPTTYASLAQAVREVKIRQLPNYLYEDLLMMFEAMQEHLMEQDKRITREAASLLKATREANTLRDPRPPAAEEWLVMMEALQEYLLERDEGIAQELENCYLPLGFHWYVHHQHARRRLFHIRGHMGTPTPRNPKLLNPSANTRPSGVVR